MSLCCGTVYGILYHRIINSSSSITVKRNCMRMLHSVMSVKDSSTGEDVSPTESVCVAEEGRLGYLR